MKRSFLALLAGAALVALGGIASAQNAKITDQLNPAPNYNSMSAAAPAARAPHRAASKPAAASKAQHATHRKHQPAS